MSLEYLKFFKKIDNVTEYVKEQIISGKCTIDEVAKFARISARQGEVGEEIVTLMANGLEETRNTVKLDETTGEPGWVVTNPAGEQYIVSDSTFKKKYEIDPEDPSKYKPVGAPVLSTTVNENIEFISPWGEEMKLVAGGSLILNKPGNVYGIQKDEFEATYASTGRDKTDCLKKAIELFEISKEDILKANSKSDKDISQETSLDDDTPSL